MSFQDKNVVITGASRGLGRALARELGARGARIVMVARHEAELEQAAIEIAQQGIEAIPRRPRASPARPARSPATSTS